MEIQSRKGGGLNTNRGVTYWTDGKESRILYAYDSCLYALDPDSGRPILSFGTDGRVSLKTGLGETAKDKFVISNTPGTLFRRSDYDAASAFRRAGCRTGKYSGIQCTYRCARLGFSYDSSSRRIGYNTWPKEVYKNTEVGAANNWAGMAVDKKRGILFVPTGSAGFDFYGGNRAGKKSFCQ